MLTEFLEYINDEKSLVYLWHNIINSSCTLCKKVYHFTTLNHNIINSIIMAYSEESWLLGYLLKHFVINKNISSIKLISMYVKLYYSTINNIKSSIIYPLIMLFIMIILTFVMKSMTDISVNNIVYIFMILVFIIYIIYVIYRIIKKVKYIILFILVIELCENKIYIKEFNKLYYKLFNKDPQIVNSYSTSSLLKMLLGIDFISIEQGHNILLNIMNDLQKYINKIPSAIYYILVINIVIYILYIAYCMFINFMNIV